jgi:hypothetical protein
VPEDVIEVAVNSASSSLCLVGKAAVGGVGDEAGIEIPTTEEVGNELGL